MLSFYSEVMPENFPYTSPTIRKLSRRCLYTLIPFEVKPAMPVRSHFNSISEVKPIHTCSLATHFHTRVKPTMPVRSHFNSISEVKPVHTCTLPPTFHSRVKPAMPVRSYFNSISEVKPVTYLY